ncbi:MAG: phospholipase D-like domain-containing protein [Aeromonadaceae bacterium]
MSQSTSSRTPPLREGNQAALVSDGEQALALRLALIREARYSIMAQYYSWEEDVSGKLLLGALIEAARRGVKVRLLVDDLYSGSNRYLESLAAEANIKVRLFNPFWLRLARPWLWPLEVLCSFRRLNHRMHNKLLVVDDEWAMVGGRNIGDGYFGLRAASWHFVDLDVVLRGAICSDLARGFLSYWRGRWSRVGHRLSWFRVPTAVAENNNEFLLAMLEPEVAHIFGVAPHLFSGCLRSLRWYPVAAQMVLDPPTKKLRVRTSPSLSTQALLDQAAQLQLGLRVVSPYLVPTRPLYRALRRLARRGVRVELLTNSLASTDMPLAYAGYLRSRRRLLQAGLALYELRPMGLRALHAKVALFDESHVLVGSLNLDPRSSYLNTEIALLLHGGELASALAEWFVQHSATDSCWPLRLQDRGVCWPDEQREPETSLWLRLWVRIASWLPLRGLL